MSLVRSAGVLFTASSSRTGVPTQGDKGIHVLVPRGFAERQHAVRAPGSSGAKTATSTRIRPRLLPDAMKPGIHGVRTHWIPGFMTLQLARRTRTVMLVVPV